MFDKSQGLMIIAALTTAVFCKPAYSASSKQEIVAGYIEECEGGCFPSGGSGQARYEVRRSSGESKPETRQLMPVFAEDIIEVGDPNAWLKLRLGSRERITVEYADSPFTVPPPKEGPSIWGNLVASFSKDIIKQFESFSGRHEARAAASLTSRGSEDEDGLPLSAGVLRHGGLTISAGARPFSLQWRGGTPPFSVRVYRNGELRPVVAADDIRDRKVSVDRISFSPGRYRIEVKDKVQRQAAEFEVVDRARLPQPPAASGLQSLPPDIARTLLATWRAGQEDGAWALESFLEAAELAEGYPPARTLRDGLAAGDMPAR